VILSAFEFNSRFFNDLQSIKVNRINNMAAYNYYLSDWEKQQGIFMP